MISGLQKTMGTLLAGMAVSTWIGAAQAESPADVSGPRISIEAKRHDLGEIYERKSYVHTFEIKNVGTADLKIEDVRPGCGCTVAEFDSIIAPGQAGKITLDIDGSKVDGTFTKAATVTSNDPEHPKVSISLGGTILEYVTIEPKRVYLRGTRGEVVAKELTITSNEPGENFEVLDVTSNIDDKLTYRVEPGTKPGVCKIKLFKNPKLPTLNTWGSLYIKTTSEHTPQKIVQVNIITRGAIVAQPAILNFGTVDPARLVGAAPIEKELTVFTVKNDFNITDITFTSDRYHAKVEALEDGKKYRVVVAFRPGSEAMYSDEMVINTDDPQEPALRVRLVARGA